MRKYGRKDSTQKAVEEAFRDAGWGCLDLSPMGNGCPDLLVCSPTGASLLIEVKGPDGTPTPDQTRFAERWPAAIYILRSAGDANALMSAVMLDGVEYAGESIH